MKKRNIFTLLVISVLLSACTLGKSKDDTVTGQKASTSKVLINELPLRDRPFITFVPHITNRLFTFYGLNLDKATESSVDVEYQSGDLLKGVKANIDTPIPNTFVKGIILGSCSTGGKCSFDKDLKTGTTKLRLKIPNQENTHLLKGDFTFVLGQNSLPDGKVTFLPSKSSAKENLILINSFGVPKVFDKEILLYPVVISSVSDKNISGELSITQSGATGAYIYDGQDYQPLKMISKDGVNKIVLNQKPWTSSVEIVRDDDKGNKEKLNLYILGPVLLTK